MDNYKEKFWDLINNHDAGWSVVATGRPAVKRLHLRSKDSSLSDIVVYFDPGFISEEICMTLKYLVENRKGFTHE